MSNQPARPGPRSDYGIIGPLLLFGGIFVLIGFWPAMVWHGYTDTGGWRWDIHSTVAELVYFGLLGFLAALIAAGNREPRPVMPGAVTELRASPPPVSAPPLCLHPGAVKVDSAVDRTLIYRVWCPDCETGLPANWRRLCCATEPESAHVYNCPQNLRGATS